MSKQNDYLKLIRELHLSSSDVCDALGRKGRLGAATQISGPSQIISGPIFHVAAIEGSNWLVHKLLHKMPEGKVVYIHHHCFDENPKQHELALVGGLICDYAINYRRALAVVVNGNVRDVEELRNKNLPVWACGSNPLVCTKEPTPDAVKLDLNDALAICDATGCAVIKKKDMTPDLEEKLKAMAKREESWFRQLKEGKSTFEITCEA